MNLIKLGSVINQSDIRNKDNQLTANAVVGLSTKKQIIPTKANLKGVSLKSYKILLPGYFAYVPDTSRRGDKISLAFNSTKNTYMVSTISEVFSISHEDILLPEYLFMYFNRPEFDRYARFNSWGSARETFSWKDMCDIELKLPPLLVQQKYVDVYNAILQNQKSYEQGLEDLKLTCDVFIDKLRNSMPSESIGDFIEQSNERNEAGLELNRVRGLSVTKDVIKTKANMKGVDLKKYKIMRPGYIAYVPDTSRRGEKMSLGFNRTSEPFLVSSISTIFFTDTSRLLPEYLMLYFSRSEFNRYARYHSWGSARETFNWEDMQDVEIPIPNISVQQSIADIYTTYMTRKEINEKLKTRIKNLCPILIKGSIQEASFKKEV